MARRVTIAKICKPRLFGAVGRQRLFAELDINRGRPLIWIDGPPGAGKTTLLASYIEARRVRALWYQIDASDGDPGTLFHYLTLATQNIARLNERTLPRLLGEHMADLQGFAHSYFRKLFERFPSDGMLVFDNYQEASGEDGLHLLVQTAAEMAPPGITVCCISRAQAPASYASLIARDAMFSLHSPALRLTLEECRAICAVRALREDWLVQALHLQSEGWAAGVTLMLERLGQQGIATGTLPTDTRESVFNYFANLLFDQASADTQQSLLSLAFIPHVTVPMAVSLSGNATVGSILEQFFRRHLFTDRRPGSNPVYQFHALFREFLQSRVKTDLGATRAIDLQLETARVLEEHGEIGSAIEIYVDVGKWLEAARILVKEARSLLDSGRRQSLIRWIALLPAQIRVDEPWLEYWLGMAHVQTSPGQGIDALRNALARFRQRDDDLGLILCLTALLNAVFLGYLAIDEMESWLDELLDKVEVLDRFPSTDTELRVRGVLCWALFWIKPWHPWTTDAPRRVEDLLPASVDANVALAAASSALAHSTMRGEFDLAKRIAATSRHLVDRDGASPAEAAWWWVQAGYLGFFPGNYEAALESVENACQIAERNSMRTTFATTILHRFMIELRLRGWEDAKAILAEVERMPPLKYPMPQAQMWLYQARGAYAEGRVEYAADLAEKIHIAILTTRSQYQEMLYGLCCADLLIAARRVDKAKPMLVAVQAIVDRSTVFDCWRGALAMVDAWLSRTLADDAVAREKLRGALLLARQGSRRYYLRYMECSMPPLFKLALEEGIDVELVQELVRLFRLKPPKDAPDNWPWPVTLRTLGKFTLSVDGEPVQFARKLPRKALLLLKALVAIGNREVPEQTLCDLLWSDEDGDAAVNALSITLVRLRKILGKSEAILHQGGKLLLNPELCWVDAWAFESRLGRDVDRRALDLYSGSFLPEDVGESWTVATRERLRGKFIHALSSHGAAMEQAGDLEVAVNCYLRGIDADAIVEEFHQGLMRCYQRLGRRSEAISAYRRMKQTLSVVLGVPPSEASQRLYRELLQGQIDAGNGMEFPADAESGGSITQLPVKRIGTRRRE